MAYLWLKALHPSFTGKKRKHFQHSFDKKNNDTYFCIKIFKTECCRIYKWLYVPSSSEQNAHSTNPPVTTQIHVSAKMFTEARFLPLKLLSFSRQKNAEAARYFVLPCKPLEAELLVMRNGWGEGVAWKPPDMHNTGRVVWRNTSSGQTAKPLNIPQKHIFFFISLLHIFAYININDTLKYTLARFELWLVKFNFRQLHIQHYFFIDNGP